MKNGKIANKKRRVQRVVSGKNTIFSKMNRDWGREWGKRNFVCIFSCEAAGIVV